MKKIKEFFGNKMVKATCALTSVAVACGVLIALINLLCSPFIIDNKKAAVMKELEKAYSELTDIEEITDKITDFDLIESAYIVYMNSDVLGYAYVANTINQFGNIKLIVGINDGGIIEKIAIAELNQTLNQAVTESNAKKYIGVSVAEVNGIYEIGTGATVSFKTLDDLVREIASAHIFLDLSVAGPYDEFYNESVVAELDITFTPVEDGDNKILAKYIVKSETEVLGTIYKLEGYGEYAPGEQGKAVFNICLDNDNKIVGHLIVSSTDSPDSYYEHTGGGYRQQVNTYLSSLYDLTVSEAIAIEIVVGAGATNSKTAVKGVLSVLATYLA